ncbi:MAG: PilW family protein [Lautropia sp.]
MKHPSLPSRVRGIALLEAIIGLTLGLIALLVIVQSFASVERFTRAGAGQAEAQQRGATTSWRLLRELRMAGAGLGHAPAAWGCTLNVWRDGIQLLPRAGQWPAPFANLPQTLLLTPIAASDDSGPNDSDQLLFASGRGAAGVTPVTTSVISASQVQATSSTGYRAGDLLLLTDATTVGGCQVGEVDAGYIALPGVAAPQAIPTGAISARYNAPTGFTGLPQPGDYLMLNLGSTPSLQMLGVNDDRELVLLDALGMMTGAEPVVLAQNVRQFQVLYGLDDGVGGVANDNVIDRWVAPNGAWAFGTLHSAATPALQVKAIRLAIVVQTDTPQGRDGPASLTLFEDLPPALQVTVPLAAAERGFQFQVYDSVIALRNEASALCAEHRRLAALPAPSICD